MSVIHYAHDELTLMAATCWNRGSIGSTDNLRYMDRMAEGVTLISKANGQLRDIVPCDCEDCQSGRDE